MMYLLVCPFLSRLVCPFCQGQAAGHNSIETGQANPMDLGSLLFKEEALEAQLVDMSSRFVCRLYS